MVRRIVWTSRADEIFTHVLKFYVERNGSKTHSRKLNKEVKEIINLLTRHPFLGAKTDFENIRVLIQGDYKIFYQVKSKELVIHLVWDCRQNPEDLKRIIK
ncbi:MAG: type II toxin-antitoxin system RelE/ParE family toxin [Bacteroidales bacterium]